MPPGVYVAVPVVVETVAVLFVVERLTDPLGVNFPVDVMADPLNVG